MVVLYTTKYEIIGSTQILVGYSDFFFRAAFVTDWKIIFLWLLFVPKHSTVHKVHNIKYKREEKK